jgi:hypothetical protein
MSGYADDYKDMEHARWLEKWVPRAEFSDPVNAENLRYWKARALEAEAKVKTFNDAIRAVKKTFNI